jgi:hypothetical protein
MDTLAEPPRFALWQKVTMAVTGVMIAPFMLFVIFLTALSLFPLFLLGRFEGDMGRAPLERDIAGAARKARRRTRAYYAGQAPTHA